MTEEVDWTKPCPAALRCVDQALCPPACRAAGNREGNHRHEEAS